MDRQPMAGVGPGAGTCVTGTIEMSQRRHKFGQGVRTSPASPHAVCPSIAPSPLPLVQARPKTGKTTVRLLFGTHLAMAGGRGRAVGMTDARIAV